MVLAPTTSRASRRCSTSSPRSWTPAATCRCSAIPTTAACAPDARARTSPPTARCSPPARCCSGAATSSSRRARSTTARAGCSARGARRRVRRARRREDAAAAAPGVPRGRLLRPRLRLRHAARDPPGRRRRPARLPLASPRTATPTRCRSRCRSAAASSWSTRAPTRTTRSRRGGTTSAAPRAHNTVRVDGLDQSVPGGNFMWLQQGARRLQPVAVVGREGQLRGLARRLHAPGRPGQAPPPDRARQARAPRGRSRTRSRWSEEHDVELFFHCSERCSVDPRRRRLRGFADDGVADPAAAGGREGLHAPLPGKRGADPRLGIARLRPAHAGADHRLARAPVRNYPTAHGDHESLVSVHGEAELHRTPDRRLTQPAHRPLGGCGPGPYPADPQPHKAYDAQHLSESLNLVARGLAKVAQLYVAAPGESPRALTPAESRARRSSPAPPCWC